ncbi:MAG: HD domain-containing protein [Saprospiraceae bacterium]|nr:HD domain-containing protein [Saprospiraceae bacterium]
MSKNKIFNDPVYGFVNIPYGILFDLVEHPYFQRLRRIKQVSLTHYVYPGALHTRFHHALGAMHLMGQAIETLRSKGVTIEAEEAEAARIAILLHDIGHGPFSHTLEHSLLNVHHEELSLLLMEKLNEAFGGALDLAIRIFRGDYPKKFLHQLISGQLDMDRMDYLNRDSFFTGVYEGVIGYDRIIKMLAVSGGELVVEEKGIYSIEKFLMARRLMYWQVYLHKTVLAAEQMLIRAVRRARQLVAAGQTFHISKPLAFFLHNEFSREAFEADKDRWLEYFTRLDDYDIVSALKEFSGAADRLLSFLSASIVDRRLFRLELKNHPFAEEYREEVCRRIGKEFGFSEAELEFLVFGGEETNSEYSTSKDEIKILFKDGRVLPMSESSDYGMQSKIVTKYYLCYPKIRRSGR